MRTVFIFLTLSLVLAIPGQAQSTRDPKNFDLQGDSRALFEDVARAYGLECVFDSDYQAGAKIRFRMQSADYREALHALEAATGSFIVPLTAKVFLVAKDSPQKRAEVEPFVAITVEVPQATTAQEATEVIRAVQQVMALEKVGIDTQRNSVVIRGPISKVMPARQLLEDLFQYHAEVNIELDLVEVSRADMLAYGIGLPNQFSIVNFSSAAKIATTLADLGRAGLNGMAFGLAIGQAQLLAKMSNNVGRSLFHMDLRSADQQPASFHIGNRYPVVTSAYVGQSTGVSGSTNTSSQTSNTGSNGTTQLTPATFGNLANPSAVAIGDFNEDGTNDLATLASGGDVMAVMIGTGNGTFGDAATFASSKNPSALVVVDLNDDGHLDVVVADAGANDVSIFLGKGDGTFDDATHAAVGSNPAAIVSGDFDGDGKPDVAVANADSDDISILLGNGDGTFKTAVSMKAGSSPRSLVSTDLNGDGTPDLAVANFNSNDLWIFLANGDGTFRKAEVYATGNAPRAVAAGNLNLDGLVDLVVANSASNTISAFLGDGTGRFTTGVQYLTGAGPVSLDVSDFNSDSLVDVAVANASDGTISLLLGLGDGSFQTALHFTVGTEPRSLAGGDLNGDGYRDLAVANFASNDFSTLLGAGNGGFVDSGGNSYPATGGQSYAPPPSFTYEDLGLVLKATPHINGSDEVSLDLEATFKLISGQAANGMPIIANRQLKSTIRLRNGEVALVAGLLSSSEARTINGIPGLSMIPVIGPITGTKTRERDATEVLVLIKTNLLSSSPTERVTRPVRVGSETRPLGPL